MVRLNRNQELTRCFHYLSELLSKTPENLNRSFAYARTCKQIRRLKKDVCLYKDWKDLTSIPTVGETIAKEIAEYCRTERFKYFEKIVLSSSPVDILMLANGLTREKADNVVELLHINTFYDLMNNYKKGKLKLCFEKNAEEYLDISNVLDFLISWVNPKEKEKLKIGTFAPSTKKLLSLDSKFRKEYPFKKIKFNKVNTPFNDGYITIQYSDSESAIKSQAMGDWVRIKFEKGGHSLLWVVITSKYGYLKGKRIIMGEEKESLRYYEKARYQEVS